MKKKVIQLMAICCLVFVGMVGVDLASESNKPSLTDMVVSVAEARGCGVGYLNHQAPDPNMVPCWYGSGATQFTIVESHDCKDSDNSCCKFPSLGNPCMSLAG